MTGTTCPTVIMVETAKATRDTVKTVTITQDGETQFPDGLPIMTQHMME